MESNEIVKKTRREQRALVIEILYQSDLQEEDFLGESPYDFVNQSVEGVFKYKEKIDGLITASLTRYTIKRLSYVDRAIIRFAVYEMIDTETPHEIVINEALNMTKRFTDEGDNKAVGFTNRLLDTISKAIEKA